MAARQAPEVTLCVSERLPFDFVNEIQQLSINNGDILVSYDVSSLFTNVPLDETIQLLIDMASRTIGSMKRTKFISVDKTLSIFSEQQLKVNFSAFQWWRIQTFR